MLKKFTSIVVTALVALVLISAPVTVGGANFQLNWTDSNTPAFQVTGYNLYMAVSTNAPTVVATVPANAAMSAVVNSLTPNLYKFWVTATNVWGESAPSMTVQTPPGLPSAAGVQLFINLK